MINLLPSQLKKTNSYGVRNRVLLRWVAAFFVGIIGIGAVLVFGHVQMNKSIKAEQEQIAQSEWRLSEQNIEKTQEKTESIDSSIKLALQVLEEKILFSKLLQRLGAVMPEGTVLEGISLQDLEGGINLTAKAESFQAATQVQVNISDASNNVFKTADILSIQCNDAAAADEEQNKYPCSVTLRALFNDDNPFLFINQDSEVGNEQ